MRISPIPRNTSKLLAAAIASVGFASSRTQAGLFIDLRATSINGNTGAITNPKAITFLNVGDTVTFNLVARVSGSNSVQLTGNFDGAVPQVNDTRNDDSIKIVSGGFQSVGTAKGNFSADNQGLGNLNAPWNAAGSNNGVLQDFDSDGDLDLGGIGTNPATAWYARAAALYAPTVSNRSTAPLTRLGVSITGNTGGGAGFLDDQGGPITGVPGTSIIDATSAETLLGEVTWTFTGGSGTVAFNFLPLNSNTSALWFEDGQATGKTPANSDLGVAGVLGIGSPVNLVLPEPSTLGLLGLSSLGLLARRKRLG